jgi:hypothetical protein
MGRLQIARLLRELSITGGNKTRTSSSRWQIISLFSIQETRIIHICTENSPLERPLRTLFRFIRFRFAGSVDESLGLFGVVGFWFCFACHETDHIRVTDAQPINLRLAMSASCPLYPRKRTLISGSCGSTGYPSSSTGLHIRGSIACSRPTAAWAINVACLR